MKSKIFAFGVMATLMLMLLTSVAGFANADESSIVVTQVNSVQSILPGETVSYEFEVHNPNTVPHKVEVAVSCSITTGYSVVIYPDDEVDVANGDTVSVFVNITLSSDDDIDIESLTFDVVFYDETMRAMVDTLHITAIVEAVYDVDITYVTNSGAQDVYVGSYAVYEVQIYNGGNSADTYQFSISDMLLTTGRANATLGEWSTWTHAFPDIIDMSDETDYITASAGAYGTFYVTVETEVTVDTGEQLVFNLTVTSITDAAIFDKQEFITTAGEDWYDVDLILQEISNETAISLGQIIYFNFSVVGSEYTAETVNINVISLAELADAGWEFKVYNEADVFVGGFYVVKGRSEISVVTEYPEVTRARDNIVDVDQYGVVTTESGFRYIPGDYEHSFDINLAINETQNYTLKILASNDPTSASPGLHVPVDIIATVMQSTKNSSSLYTTGNTTSEYEGIIPPPAPLPSYVIWIALGAVGLIVVVGVAMWLKGKRSNYPTTYRPKQGKGCKPGYQKRGDKCIKK